MALKSRNYKNNETPLFSGITEVRNSGLGPDPDQSDPEKVRILALGPDFFLKVFVISEY